MIQKAYCLWVAGLVTLCSAPTTTQQGVEMSSFGNMDQWVTREIKESGTIGGSTEKIYVIEPTEAIVGMKPYTDKGGSPWVTLNVMARVSGITKTNIPVLPEARGDGFYACLDIRMESVKVLGIVDITVLATGSMPLGTVCGPIKNAKNPNKMLQMGVPFIEHPSVIQFDYKVKMSDHEDRMRATGFSEIADMPGRDFPAVILLLQKRWEDAKRNVYARRIGTVVNYHYHSIDWKDGATYNIMYGDMTSDPVYKTHMMRLQASEYFTASSKGESAPIHEVAWGEADDVPAHTTLQFTSSHGGVCIGSPGNSLYINNVKLVYQDSVRRKG